MRKLFLVICAVLCATGLYAQGTKVQGTITSKEDGQPLAGVTVMIKGTFTGTSTDANGSYAITLPGKGGGTLTFSY